MEVTLYSTGCSKCSILKRKLDDKGVSYKIVSDSESMAKEGIKEIPQLKIGNMYLKFPDANDWINSIK